MRKPCAPDAASDHPFLSASVSGRAASGAMLARICSDSFPSSHRCLCGAQVSRRAALRGRAPLARLSGFNNQTPALKWKRNEPWHTGIVRPSATATKLPLRSRAGPESRQPTDPIPPSHQSAMRRHYPPRAPCGRTCATSVSSGPRRPSVKRSGRLRVVNVEATGLHTRRVYAVLNVSAGGHFVRGLNGSGASSFPQLY